MLKCIYLLISGPTHLDCPIFSIFHKTIKMLLPIHTYEHIKKMHFLFFFPREARFCFRERHGCAFARVTAVPLGNEKKTRFLFFFLPRESRFCFHERHGSDFVRGTGMPLSERKKTRVPGLVFSSVFFVKKSFVKTYQHGIWF